MKKIKSRILLGFGMIAILTTTSSVVLSCGSSNSKPKPPTDQDKLNGVTIDMVKTVITKFLAPTTSKQVPPNPVTFKVSINGLDDVIITVSSWMQLLDGSVSFSIKSIDKGTAHVDGAQFGNISISGFQSNGFSSIAGLAGKNINATLYSSLNKYFVATRLGLWTSNNGEDFTQVTLDRTGQLVESIIELNSKIYAITQFSGLYISDAQESTFTRSDALDGKGLLSAIYLTPDKQKIYVGTGDAGAGSNGLWVSEDGGTTFNQVTASLGIDWYISSIYQTGDGSLFVGTQKTISGSKVAHGLWMLKKDNPNFTQVQIVKGQSLDWEISNIYQTSDNKIFVSTNNTDSSVPSSSSHGLWVSNDMASSFTNVNNGIGSDWIIHSIYQTPDGKIFVASDQNGLWLSIDNGISFTQVTEGLDKTHINSVYQTPDGKIYVGTDSGLYVTTY